MQKTIKKKFSQEFVPKFYQVYNDSENLVEQWHEFSDQGLLFFCNLFYLLAATCNQLALQHPKKMGDLIIKHAFCMKHCGIAIKTLSNRLDLAKRPLIKIFQENIIGEYFWTIKKLLAAKVTEHQKEIYLKSCLELLDSFDLQTSKNVRRSDVESQLAELCGYENSGYDCNIS